MIKRVWDSEVIPARSTMQQHIKATGTQIREDECACHKSRGKSALPAFKSAQVEIPTSIPRIKTVT